MCFFEYVYLMSPLGASIFNFLVTNWIFDLAGSLEVKEREGFKVKYPSTFQNNWVKLKKNTKNGIPIYIIFYM